MRKYLQACEVGGSIYGKRRTADKKRISSGLRKNKEDLMSARNRLYKNQVAALDKVFQRDK